MRIGVVFPQTEIGSDPAAIRDFVQTAEQLGYRHILAYDHVLGANPASRPGWRPPYTHQSAFHEPLVLFGYLAALTTTIELVTGILILPQRQTALVAKQAAALDLLSGGRLRLGIGIGWNRVEYEALNETFANRGRRSEEQIAVLRMLWTNELVTFEGRWHKITDAGINPLPTQRPIPIWFGGGDDRVLRRLASVGDGWFPQLPPDEKCRAAIEKIAAYAREAGRNPKAIGIEGRITINQESAQTWHQQIRAWKELGATHLSVNTMKAGFATAAAHIEAIRRFHEATKELW
ncbi:MAG: TIGR03619 family F420-dependent LLM class oxidoreductase [Deltaproteobacteria bacterium]|nr:TIGR03619 family F420-dependent LLM class oxidoreductase [Deltaproteobacteria bacterium]